MLSLLKCDIRNFIALAASGVERMTSYSSSYTWPQTLAHSFNRARPVLPISIRTR